jgi:hypothetical protein
MSVYKVTFFAIVYIFGLSLIMEFLNMRDTFANLAGVLVFMGLLLLTVKLIKTNKLLK